MAADIAPNLGRSAFGFERWKQHDPSVWEPLLVDARARRERGLASVPIIRASDHDARAVDAALSNCDAAGLAGYDLGRATRVARTSCHLRRTGC